MASLLSVNGEACCPDMSRIRGGLSTLKLVGRSRRMFENHG